MLAGYRYFDTRKVEPRLAFGHGLSYTRFEYSQLELNSTQDGARISFELANTGERDGQEVVQIYLHDYESKLARPEQELVAFRKLDLRAGSSQRVEIELDRRAFSYFDPEVGDWVAEPGAFEVRVGASSRDLRLRGEFTLA